MIRYTPYHRFLLALAASSLLFMLAACDSASMSSSGPSPTPLPPYMRGATIDGIRCDMLEQTAVHYHVHLSVFINGQSVQIPTDVGRQTPNCLYWLHTHAITGDEGVIHVEAPANQALQLYQFFDIWGQQLSTANLLGHQVDAAHTLTVYVYTPPQSDIDAYRQMEQQAEQQGQPLPPFTVTPSSSLQPYTGDPRQIQLKAYELIYLMYGQQAPLDPWSFLGGE